MSTSYDPLSPAVVANPYPTYQALRAAGPVSWSKRLGSWVLVNYRDCHQVLSDAELFASDWRRAGLPGPEVVLSMQGLDPPDQLPLRRLFTNALRDQDLAGIGRAATADAVELLARHRDADSFDFATEVARPVGLNAVSRLLGLDPPEVSEFGPLVELAVRNLDAGLLPEVREPAAAGRRRLNELIKVWFAGDGRSGIINTTLAVAPAAGIAPEAVWNSSRVLFLAGYSTTVAACVNAALALLTHDEAFDQVRSGVPLGPAVDELMRFDAAVQGTTRACVRNTSIGGVEMARGDLVLLLFAAANRDPAHFADPDTLHLDRTPNRHLSLGWGAHYCIGALLAKLVVGAIVSAVADAPDRLRLAAEPNRSTRATMRYPDTLPVTFRPALVPAGVG